MTSDFAIDDDDNDEQENRGDPNDGSHDAQIWTEHDRGKSPEQERRQFESLDDQNVWDGTDEASK